MGGRARAHLIPPREMGLFPQRSWSPC